MLTEEDLSRITVQYISHDNGVYDQMSGIRAALAGGCRWIQLRCKHEPDEEVVRLGKEARRLCDEHRAVLIIDDRAHLVSRIGADGVHLGLNDMPIKQARSLLGEKCIIGGTANTIADVRHHHAQGADYIGCGPFRHTTTKERLAPLLGINGYAEILQAMAQEQITLPLIAIGGIRQSDIPKLMTLPINGVAVSSGVLNANNPIEEMNRYINLINNR